MAENEDGQEKSQDPSEKRLRESAEKGQIAQSKEISTAAVLFAGAAALVFASGRTTEAMKAGIDLGFRFDSDITMTREDAMELSFRVMDLVAAAIFIPLLFIFIAAVVSGLAQTRGRLATKALEPKFDKLNFVNGFKQNYLSSQPLAELAKGLAKLLALSFVTWRAISKRMKELPALSTLEPGQLLEVFVDMAWTIVVSAMPLLIVIAAADYAYQYYRNRQQIMMTMQEVKDERKEMEGDPMVRAARRARARQYATGSMLAAVAEADVLITNPTHYAIALRYKKAEAPAPVVVAMGIDHLALKMRQKAREHDIIQVENRPLARALYAQAKVGHMIPDEHYSAVAQVLALVYQRRNKRRAALGLGPAPAPGS